jgi:putative transposase
MRNVLLLLNHLVVCSIRLLHPGGIKPMAAENLILRQQLIVLNRSRRRSPRLTQIDRALFAILAHIIPQSRLHKPAIILKPATILKFHSALVKRKYRLLYSAKSPGKPGPKGPEPQLIKLVVELKQRNPRMGYDRIAIATQMDQH